MHGVGAEFGLGRNAVRAPAAFPTTTTHAMISDRKPPFASDSISAGELKPPAETSAPLAPISASRPSPSWVRVWLRRFGVLLFVFLCATLGVMLMIVPWRPEWADNPLLMPYPALRAAVGSGFARGVATGLGALNVWIGFWEAIQYREEE